MIKIVAIKYVGFRYIFVRIERNKQGVLAVDILQVIHPISDADRFWPRFVFGVIDPAAPARTLPRHDAGVFMKNGNVFLMAKNPEG